MKFSGAFILATARLTVLEAVRARLPWLVCAIALLLAVFAQFLGQVAIVETAEVRATILAALARVTAVFLVVVFICGSMAREAADKVAELLLAQAVPRWAYFAGKSLGYLAVSSGLAFTAGLLLALLAPGPGLMAWLLSLLCELAIMGAVALFCALSFSQALTATSAAAGFYLLSRSIGTMQLIAAASLADQASSTDRLIAGMVNALSLLLPPLDRMTLSSWLASPPDNLAIAMLLGQTLVYLLLLCAGSMFDLYRKAY